jgi:hypothetical protein
MRFTQLVRIAPLVDDDWFDPVLTEDTPLYVDPFLVFDSEHPLFADSHGKVVQFFALCRELVRRDDGRRNSTHWRKALRLLTFPEPKEFALGLAMGSPNGAGTSEYYSEQMADALEAICQAGERGLDYVEMLAIFVPGLGVDRISDIFCNILKSNFIRYTQQVCERHGLQPGVVTVRNASWSASAGRWSDGRSVLPVSPITNGAVLLTPDQFLQNIPLRITAGNFYSWAEANVNERLRDDLNYDLGEALTQAERGRRGRRLAFSHPDVAFRYVDDVADKVEPVPYNVAEDPQGLVRWFEVGHDAGRIAVTSTEPLGQPSENEFHGWLGTLIDRFQHSVEHSDLWRALWNDELTRPRKEKIVQAIAGSMWTILCESANVDISKEANVGRGPVDFKFSAGWKQRALIEVKLLSSSKLRQGAEAQLPQYMISEQIKCAYYVCVGFIDDELADDRIKLVRQTCSAYESISGYMVTPRFIDARPKDSASKLSV